MLKKKITEAFEPLATLFFPPHCAYCKTRLEAGMDFCTDCEALIERIKAPRCESCSQPYDCATGEFTCPNCRGEAFYFECAVAVVRSRSVIRDLIHRIKYGKEIWRLYEAGKLKPDTELTGKIALDTRVADVAAVLEEVNLALKAEAARQLFLAGEAPY